MSTALELIESSARLIGVVANGESLTPEEAQDALTAFNHLLDSLSARGVVCHALQLQAIPWAAGVASKTVGPSGQFIGNRPVNVRDNSYYDDGDIDYPLEVIGEREFNAISMKDLSGSNPDYLYVNYTSPNATLYLYPIPSSSITVYLSSVSELTQLASLSSQIVVPPGYKRAFRYNLATEISAEFGVEAPASVQKIAWQSMRFIKRTNEANSKTNLLHLPSFLTSTHSNIYEG